MFYNNLQQSGQLATSFNSMTPASKPSFLSSSSSFTSTSPKQQPKIIVQTADEDDEELTTDCPTE